MVLVYRQFLLVEEQFLPPTTLSAPWRDRNDKIALKAWLALQIRYTSKQGPEGLSDIHIYVDFVVFLTFLFLILAVLMHFCGHI